MSGPSEKSSEWSLWRVGPSNKIETCEGILRGSWGSEDLEVQGHLGPIV